MHKKYILFITVSLLCIAMTSVFAGTNTVNLNDALQLARKNNLNLKSNAIDLKAAQRDIDTSWNLFLPSLSATLSNVGGTAVFKASPVPSNPKASQTGLGLGFSLSLTLNPAVKQQLESYNVVYSLKSLTYAQAQAELERSVTKTFYYLLMEAENLKLQKDNITLSEKQYEKVKTQFEAGFASELQLLSAQLGYEQLKPSFTQSQNSYDATLLSFKVLLGLDLDEEIVIEGEIPTFIKDLDVDTLKTYLANNYSLRLLDLNLASLENTKELNTKSALMPTITLQTKYDISSLFNSGSSSLSSSTPWSDSATYTVALSIPIDAHIPGSRTQVSLSKIQDSIDQLAITKLQSRTSMEQSITTQVNNLNMLLEQLEVAAFNRELTERIFEMTTIQYESGYSGYLDVEEAQADLFKSDQSILALQYQYISGLVDLLYDLNIDSNQIRKEL